MPPPPADTTAQAQWINNNPDLLGLGPADADVTIGMAPNTDSVSGNKFETVFDETVGLEKYLDETQNITLLIPPIKKEVNTCEDTCKEKNRIADEKCKIIRKRVEEALKKAGCPTRLVAQKRPGCGYSKSVAKKSTRSKKRR